MIHPKSAMMLSFEEMTTLPHLSQSFGTRRTDKELEFLAIPQGNS
jgi:hypothetical protein